MTTSDLDRSFHRLAEGLVHVRSMGDPAAPGQTPLLLLHLSPSSSRSLVPLMQALRDAGCQRALIAPDTLGNGDSAAPACADADIAYFADSMIRLIDAMGIDRVDVYGTHTGARIACEMAAAHPDRIGVAVLSGITEYGAEVQALYRAHYAPHVEPDEYGRQMVWGFNFMRDQHLFAPYFLREAQNRLAKTLPTAREMHDGALDILKALDSYHIPYLAAFAYPTMARAAAVAGPALLLQAEWGTPALNAAADAVAAVMARPTVIAPTGGMAGYAAAIHDFLNAHSASAARTLP